MEEEKEKLFFTKHRDVKKQMAENSTAWYATRYRVIEDGNEGTQCIQCKGNKVDYVFRQTRSADEGMTVFYTCRDCNRQWSE
jgi:DNA-directed RNA polymerase subunit M/transcription elongation factor TFIIS